MLEPSDAREILEAHDAYWSSKRRRMRQLKSLYMTHYWDNEPVLSNVSRRTEVPKAYAVVESYLGSLYAKNPSVVVTPDLRARGNAEVAEATANQYLLTIREQLEDATRLALIYPCSFIKLAPVESVDPLKRVSTSALAPWEVVLDVTAGSWSAQRYVGHVYLMPEDEALERFNVSADQLRARSYSKWIDQTGSSGQGATLRDTGVDSSDKWVRVFEVYDLRADKLLVWSEDFNSGNSFLFEGIQVQVGALPPDPDEQTPQDDAAEVEHVTTGIPFKTASGRPVVPIVPLYLSRDPDTPLRGYSLLDRSYDQFRELNVLRTYQSQGVMRMARQWMVRAGFFDDEAGAKIAEGRDGEFIEVDVPPGASIEGNIMPVPNAPIPADITLYAQTVTSDINDAGLMAPFTRGEVTNTTATEQRLLADYTSSEVGRMARTRDEVVTTVARTFNVMLAVMLGEEAEPLALPNPIGPTMLSADDLTGDFGYFAQDAGSTPMSDDIKRQSLERLAPLLLSLGADPTEVREELVRTYDLPTALAAAPPPPPEPPALEEAPMAGPASDALPFPAPLGV
tara:strand:+ start:314 stop:2014 length:1701 start_codon:yes stop_codon:yes gene_type:complete